MGPLHPQSSSPEEHAAAVSRRLSTLSAELAAVRGDPPVPHRHTQVRNLHAVEPADDHEVPIVPVPGRHASRGLLGALPPGFRFTAVHLALIALVVAAAIGVAAWFAVRSDPEPVPSLAPVGEPLAPLVSNPGAPSSAVPSVQAPAPVTEGDPGAVSGGEEVTVDVAGKVRRPGIAVLPPGARVVDALEAAGGARRGVRLTSLNLARPLVDGEQILVGVAMLPGVVGSIGTSPGVEPTGALVNLNSADETLLETLPGVGPVTAAAILGWRTEHGRFTAVEELLEVDGIGEATLAEIAPHVTI